MRRKGLTLPELAIVIAIIGVLVTLSFAVYPVAKAKLNSATCVGNLKALHAGMSVYLQDHDLVWPQMPDDEESDNQEQASADPATGGGEEDDNGEEAHGRRAVHQFHRGLLVVVADVVAHGHGVAARQAGLLDRKSVV